MAVTAFTDISDAILANVAGLSSASATVAGWVAPAIGTVMIIMIIFYGINVWNGTAKASIVDLAKQQLKPFIVLSLMIAGGAYASNVVGFFTDLQQSFTTLFTGTPGGSYAALDAAASLANDVVAKSYLPVKASVSILTVTSGEWVYFFGSLMYAAFIFIFCGVSCVVLILITYSLTFVWAVGPFFLAFLAFNSTQSLGTPWLSSAFKYTFSMILISFCVGIANNTISAFSASVAGKLANDTAGILQALLIAIAAIVVLILFVLGGMQVAADVTGGMAVGFQNIANAAASKLNTAGGSLAGKAGGAAGNAAGALGRGAGMMGGDALKRAGGSLSGSNNSARASIGRGMAGLGKAMQQPAINRASAKADAKKKTNMSSTASVVNGAGYVGAKATSIAGAGVSALGRGAQSLGKKLFDANASNTGAIGAVARGAGGLLYGSGAVADKAGKAASYVGDSFSGDSAKASLSKTSGENYIQAAKPSAANATPNASNTEAVAPAKAGSPASIINTANSQAETSTPSSEGHSKAQTPQAVSSAIASSAASQAEPTTTTAPRSSSSTFGSSIQAKSASPSSPPPSRGRQTSQRKTLKAKAGQAIANAGRSMSQSVAADSQAPGRVIPTASKLKANLGNALDKIGNDLSQSASKNVSRRTVNRETK